MASTTAEIVITAMQLDASNYVANSKKIIAANQAMNSSAQALIKQYQALQNAFNSAQSVIQGGNLGSGNQFNFNNLSNFNNQSNSFRAGGGGGNGGSGRGGGNGLTVGLYMGLRLIREIEHALVELGHDFVSFSKNAITEFSSFETLQRSFEGIYGSAEKANHMMMYLRNTAQTSAFHFRDLADAARGLSVAGLDVNRFLPITQGFALAMGHIDAAGLNDFVSLLRRLQGGNTGLALGPRGIGRYGVTRGELEQYGAKFDDKQHFIGSINDAFNAIEGVFKNRIQQIAEKVTSSSEVVMSNWADAVQQATIDAGAGIAQNLIGPIKTLTGAMNTLRQAGVFKDLFDDIYRIIDIQGIIGSSTKARYDGFKDKSERREYIRERFNLRIGQDGLNLAPTTSGDKVQDLLISIGGGIVTLVQLAKNEVEQFEHFFDILRFWNVIPASVNDKTPVGDALKAGEDFKKEAYRDVYNEYLRNLIHPNRLKAPDAPAGVQIPGEDDDAQPEIKNHLRAIHEHARNIDHFIKERAHNFGGGDIGAIGVTPVELSARHGGASTSIEGVMAAAGRQIKAIMDGSIIKAQAHGLRQGYLGGQRI